MHAGSFELLHSLAPAPLPGAALRHNMVAVSFSCCHFFCSMRQPLAWACSRWSGASLGMPTWGPFEKVVLVNCLGFIYVYVWVWFSNGSASLYFVLLR